MTKSKAQNKSKIQMTNIKTKDILSFVLIFFSSFLLRLPGAILAPTNYFYDLVERAEIFSILGLFAGLIPAAVTFWSLGIYGIPLILFYTLDFLLFHPQVILQPGPGILLRQLSIYIAEAYLDPTRQLIIGRLLVAVVTSFAPIALWMFFRKKKLVVAAFFSIVLFLTSPFLVAQNYSLLPDSLGLAFFGFALAVMLQEAQLSPQDIFLGSIFLGLAIAAKFIYVAFLPVAFLAILFNGAKFRNEAVRSLIKNLLIFTGGLLLVIFIFIPYIWTAPLALAKNLFGTLRQYYGHQNCWRFLLWQAIPAFISRWGIPFCILGFISSFFVLHKKIAFLLAVGFFSFLVPLGNADFILERYALPLIPYLCIYAGIGLDLVTEKVKKSNLRILLLVLVMGVICMGNLMRIRKDFKITHSPTNAIDCVNWIKENISPGTNLAIPAQLDCFFTPSESTLERWINNLNASYENIVQARLKSLFFLARTKDEYLNQDNPLILRIFGPLEQQRLFVYKILLWYARNIEKPNLAYHLFLYLPAKDEKLGITTAKKEKLLNLFLQGEIPLFISDEYLSLPSISSVKSFNRCPGETYYVYLNRNEDITH